MKNPLPYTLSFIGLLMLWLLLQQSVSPAHILLAIVIALVTSLALVKLELPVGQLHRPLTLVKLVGLVVHDIVRSNLAVARIILRLRSEHKSSAFLDIPLAMRSPYGLAALGVIITSTPGTLWVNFDSTRGILTIHVLDLIDEDAWIQIIKGRYERLLMEVFE